MKKAVRVVLGLLGLVVLVAGAGAGFLALKKPAQQPPSSETIERTPARLARGEYLVKHVVVCLDCHSDQDPELYGIPPKPGTEGQGGFCFNKQNVGFPGQVCAQNITSDPVHGLGRWTDGEVLRAIREGVDRKGDALFPMMPYEVFRNLSDEDAKSIVAYIRTLPPIRRAPPPRAVDFPVNLAIKFKPQPVTHAIATPDPKDTVAYGKYLASLCSVCHTPVDSHMQPIEEKAFSGGRVFAEPGIHVVSANLTPDATGIGGKTREQFIGEFKAYASAPPAHVAMAHNTVMPWPEFAGMTEEDLGAIYDYLQTLPKIQNTVNRWPLASRTP